MALTDTEIKKAKAKEKAYRMSDSGGLYLSVTPSGGKLWRWRMSLRPKKSSWRLGNIRMFH
ncbi:Arm DNA-binding domain-containing protein [Tunturiibacter lichenicola]